jgi:hypothetical protein
MKTTTAILILIATLSSQISSSNLFQTVFGPEDPGGVSTLQDPPDDGKVIIQPPPR